MSVRQSYNRYYTFLGDFFSGKATFIENIQRANDRCVSKVLLQKQKTILESNLGDIRGFNLNLGGDINDEDCFIIIYN